MLYSRQNCVAEWSYTSGKAYDDPFNEVTLDVEVTDPDGVTQLVPAYWAGDQTWRVRYASPKVGRFELRSRCSDTDNADLHDQQITLQVQPYNGTNPLRRHGRLQVAENGRTLEHQDGTPFLWLGDTWWMALCRRLRWPEEFQELTADRVQKGFSVIQIVAGLYPDMEPFDERGANEAGFPWEKDFSRINPDYFDMADLRLTYLVDAGLVPCIVGCWGFFLDFAGAEVLKKHWRYLIARYGAYPVVWCAAGEALMPYYRSEEFQRMLEVRSENPSGGGWLPAEKRATWSDIMRTMRETDPYGNPMTIHPTRVGLEQVDDPSVMDIHWLQTGHGGYRDLTTTINMLETALSMEPKMPVLDSEVNYEGILESSREEIQRFLFWSCLLSGAAGHTYGANGLWQVNRREQPYGLSPHGTAWGHLPWDDAYRLPGSGQLGLAKKFLERFNWWQFEPHPEWVSPHQTPENRMNCYAAGIPGQVRVIFIPAEAIRFSLGGQMLVTNIEPDCRYRAYYFNPKTGEEVDLGEVTPDDAGNYQLGRPPIFQDWVAVLEQI